MLKKIKAKWESSENLFSHCWSFGDQNHQLIAVCSFVQSSSNHITILDVTDGELSPKYSVRVDLPVTDCAFIPVNGRNDLLATASEYLRIWSIKDDMAALLDLFSPSSNPTKCGPITSISWPKADPDQLIVGSSDTTVTIWSLVQKKTKTRLIAHDCGVNCVGSSPNPSIFATCAFDGSMRIFDQRDLSSSIIVYDSPQKDSLIHLDWNQVNEQFISAVGDAGPVIVVDVRRPNVEYARLNIAMVEDARFSPFFGDYLFTVGPSQGCFIWWQAHKETWAQKPQWKYTISDDPLIGLWNPTQPNVVSLTSQNSLQYFSI